MLTVLQLSQLYINPIPPTQTGCDTRSIFKWITVGLNSQFTFFLYWLPYWVYRNEFFFINYAFLEREN